MGVFVLQHSTVLSSPSSCVPKYAEHMEDLNTCKAFDNTTYTDKSHDFVRLVQRGKKNSQNIPHFFVCLGGQGGLKFAPGAKNISLVEIGNFSPGKCT